MDTYHISISPLIIDSILHTNLKEARGVFDLKAMLKILALLAVPFLALFLMRSKKMQNPRLKDKFLLLGFYLLVILGISLLQGRDIIFAFKAYKPMIDMLNPIAPIRSTIRYVSAQARTPKTYAQIGVDATLSPGDAPKIIVLVIGESSRAQNFAYNGYLRPTNPYTKDFASHLINFPHFFSCGVITAISIPCMLTDLTHNSYTTRNLSYYRDNILDIAKRAGYEVWWISNNGGECMGKVCQRLRHIRYFDEGGARNTFDGAMLGEISSIIQNARHNTFLVINLYGSHGPKYFERYPKEFEHFTPVCKSPNLQTCSKEEIENAYDNSLRYSDFFLASVMKSLAASPLHQALWYVSDHGESLGEYGQYMHGGLPYSLSPEEQKHIPSLLYLGKGYEALIPTLKEHANKIYNQDYVFHSLLHLLDIKTHIYNKKLDIFAQ